MARMVIGDDLMANNKLNERELAAKKILQEMGWEPERINITYYNKGMPDFKCSENRYVEVKPSGFSDGDQMMRWEELSRQGNKFYIFMINIIQL